MSRRAHPAPDAHPSRALLLALTLAAAALTLAPTPAQARPRLAVEIRLGLTVPFSRYVQSTSVLIEQELDGALVNIPYIADATHSPGLAFGGTVTFREYEFSINGFFFDWGDSFLRFEGDRPARAVGEDRIDDAGVVYSPLEPPERLKAPIIGSDGLQVLTFDGGYRYYLSEDIFEAYVPMGGGLVLANERERGDSKIGLHAFVGFTTELVVAKVAFLVDARYHFILTDNAVGVQQGANNAVVANENVLEALISTLHFATVTLGFRYAID